MAPLKPQAVGVTAICAALTAVSVLAVGYVLLVANSAKLEKAVALNEHGHSGAARLELISLIYGPASRLTLDSEDRAAALHLLGEISLEDDELSGTLSAWGLLVKEYPDSQLAESVRDKIADVEADFHRQLSDLKSEAQATLHFAIAEAWLKAAGAETPSVDTSFISDEEAAIDWLSLTIEKFPGTSHAELAYERMVEYQLAVANKKALFYMELQSTIDELNLDVAPSPLPAETSMLVRRSESILVRFQSAFPESGKLQRLRYLIGQSNWLVGDMEKARYWLTKVIEEDRDVNTFYRDLAFRRLQNLPSLHGVGEAHD